MKKRFDWCLKQTKGLKLIDKNENLMKVYLNAIPARCSTDGRIYGMSHGFYVK